MKPFKKKTILDILTGAYKSISKQFFKSDTYYTINDSYQSIKKVYINTITEPLAFPICPKKQFPKNPLTDKWENTKSVGSKFKTTSTSSPNQNNLIGPNLFLAYFNFIKARMLPMSSIRRYYI